MVKLCNIILLLLLIPTLFAGFELRSLKVSVYINSDGSAHATEEALIFMDSESSIRLYEDSVIFNDLSSWADRTQISDLRTHISRAYVDVVDLRVRPQPVHNCNNLAQTCFATLILDYDVFALSENTSGITKMSLYKPRTTRHVLNSDVFSFTRSKTNDIILPRGYSLQITIPQIAKAITFSKIPDNADDTSHSTLNYDSVSGANQYLGELRSFIWENQTLSQFALSFEIENSLEYEISYFFSNLQSKLFGLLSSSDGIAYTLAGISFLFPLIWLHSLEKKG